MCCIHRYLLHTHLYRCSNGHFRCTLKRVANIFHYTIIGQRYVLLRQYSPWGHAPHIYVPGKFRQVTTGSMEQCGFRSAHSSTSIVHAGVMLLIFQPWSQIQRYPLESLVWTHVPCPHSSADPEAKQSTLRRVQWIPCQPGEHMQLKMT